MTRRVQVPLGQPPHSHPTSSVFTQRSAEAQRGRGADALRAAANMQSISRSWLLLCGFVLFYVIYLLFGALVFSSIERPVEERLRHDMKVLTEDFLNRSCVNAASLERFLLKVLRANKYGVSVIGNSSGATNWDLASSMFFANTLVTTVGYGHTSPLSDAGKAFSIIYALLGVPFTMLVLTACVQRLMYPLVIAPVGTLQRWGLNPRPATIMHFVLLLVLVLLGFFLAPAAVFSTLEASWTFLDGIYFCFISLCTIGLGDFVPATQPGVKQRGLYQISVMEISWKFPEHWIFELVMRTPLSCCICLKPVYLFLGLMMMYLLLSVFHKMADLHGLTTLLQLPRCDDSDLEEDREPIVGGDPKAPPMKDKAASKPLDPSSQASYNSISKG